jgi:hypothetical protein
MANKIVEKEIARIQKLRESKLTNTERTAYGNYLQGLTFALNAYEAQNG